MSYVPVFTPSSSRATARARRLGKQITATIEEFRRQNPGLSPLEINQALWLVRAESGRRKPAILAVLVAVMLLLIGILVFLADYQP